MCYSAMVWEDYQSFVRRYGATIDIDEFARLYEIRNAGADVKIPKGMDFAFVDGAGERARAIAALIAKHNESAASKYESELFAQRRRLVDAERKLLVKETKAARNDIRVATNKIAQRLGWLTDLRRKSQVKDDSRIYPRWYAPVMISEGGKRVVRPMRYLLRPAGFPPSFDDTHDGAYNARRNNLSKFWRRQFGQTHGVVVAQRFYEHVKRHRPDGSKYDVVLEFEPQGGPDMLAACIWSKWEGDGETLYTFAAVTDDPPPEVAAAGHDRCIIPIREANLDSWLNPDAANLAAQYAILDDRERPYYEHRLAA